MRSERAAFLALWAALAAGCEQAADVREAERFAHRFPALERPVAGAEAATPPRLAMAPGVTIPSPEELASRLQGRLTRGAPIVIDVPAPGGKITLPPAPPVFSATVRAYDTRTGVAVVDVQDSPALRMPVLQKWRFNGRDWSDEVDPGIFRR